MIIVSQDKEITNFDNVTRIFIEDFSEDGDGFGIGADTNSAESQCWDLGYYKTEERAKEVLNSVTAMYQANELMKATKSDITQEQMVSQFLNKKTIPFKYEMPES